MIASLGLEPGVVGTVPQWGMFITFIGVALAFVPKIRQQNFDFTAAARKVYEDRITSLEKKVEDCEEDREAKEAELKRQIKDLHDELFGLRKQHIQEQISFVQAIIRSVDSPELKSLLAALDRGHRAVVANESVYQLTGVRGDVKGEEG